MTSDFRGIYAILATPFDEHRKIDEESLKSLVDFELRAGVHGITILGILGEVSRLSDAERRLVTRIVVEHVHGRVPVISGTGGSGTDLAIMYSKEAVELGADAVMSAPPRLTKPNDDAIYAYYRDLGRELNIPIVVQDEPVTCGVHLSPALLARLAEIDRIGYVKLEDPPTTMKMSQMKKLIGDRLRVFGGLGGLYAYEELCRGACGIMTGFAYPEVLVKLYQKFVDGDTNLARELFYRALPIIRYEAQPAVGLAIRKEILRRRGAIEHSKMRDPAPKLDQETLKELDEIVEGSGIAELVTT